MTINYIDAAMNLSAKTRRETLEEVEALIKNSMGHKWASGRVGWTIKELLDEIKKLPRENK